MRALRMAAVMALSVLVFSGCEMSRPYRNYSNEVDSWPYSKRFAVTLEDWGMDFVDIFSVELGVGECIGIVIQPTEILQTGFLFGDVGKLGWRNRGLGFYHEVQKEGGIGWAYYRYRLFEPFLGTPSLFDRPPLFAGFPIRTNEEGHWMDFGGEIGLVFVEGSAHLSPKHALNFCVNTLMLPVNLLLRYPFMKIGIRLPEVDLCGEDTPTRLEKKYDLHTIGRPNGFVPTEVFNELWEVPY